MSKKGHYTRFSLVALIVLVLFIVGFFAGYRSGYENGFLRVTNNVVYTEFYPVGDLVTPFENGHGPRGADYDTLIEILQSTVLPSEWDDIRKITLLKDVRVAAISHSREGHDSIRELLEQVRLPLQRFEDLVDQGKCPYCAKAPLPPELGDRCTNCNVARHQPTYPAPSATVMRP